MWHKDLLSVNGLQMRSRMTTSSPTGLRLSDLKWEICPKSGFFSHAQKETDLVGMIRGSHWSQHHTALGRPGAFQVQGFFARAALAQSNPQRLPDKPRHLGEWPATCFSSLKDGCHPCKKKYSKAPLSTTGEQRLQFPVNS